MPTDESARSAELTPRAAPRASRAEGENGRLTRWSDLPGVELLHANYKRHAYLPHWHDTYTIALVKAGCERVRLGGTQTHVYPSRLVLLHPGEIHDGEAEDPAVGWDFRALYLSSETLIGNSTELERTKRREIAFRQSILEAPELWQAFLALHEELSQESTLLARTTRLYLCLSKLAEYAVQNTSQHGAGCARLSLDRVRQFLHANWADPISLQDLAQVAGLSRFHLLREFRKFYGLPPHAYQLQLRVLRAKAMLFEGAPAREVALAAGFYDQAHLIRAMKRYVGVSPGRIYKHV